MTKTLSIVVPVYYNAESLPHLFASLKSVQPGLLERGVRLELIFVNDGSGDNSLEQLLAIKREAPETKVISLSRNFGATAASKTGFKFVTGDGFTTLSADMQDPPEQLLLMVDKWLEGHKFVVCVRQSRKDPLLSRLLARLYYLVLRRMIAPGYPSGGYDMTLMDKVMLPYMAGSTKHTNASVYAFWLGFKPCILLYERRERMHGKSRYTFRKKLRFLMDTVSGFSATPIRLLSLFGSSVAVVSFLYCAYIVIMALLGFRSAPGFVTLAALISFFSGLILFMLGALGEYLWRVFAAVNDMPEAVIDETFL